MAESYPPQCQGLPVEGWDWTEHRGDFDDAGGVRFGTFAVTGGFDGTTVRYESAVAGALYDPMPRPEPTSSAAEQHSAAELETIGQELQELPGAFSTMPGDNFVVVDVVHDDGSLQDWADHRGDFDNAGGVRFGTFAVTGGFDGTTLTYESAVSGALYDPMPWPEPTSSAAENHSPSELEAIGRELQELPGALSTMPGDNLVVVDVVHDDGSLQDWADATYGAGLVFVHSALRAAS